MVVLRANQMRPFCSILFVILVAVGCNADPRCRRETALLRAEILDLEDKLAFATAGSPLSDGGSYYDGQVISSSGEVIISEPAVDLGNPQIIYESDASYSSNPTLYAAPPLEVQHQIFPNTPTGSATKSTQSIPLDDLNIQIDSPQPPTDLDSIVPNANQQEIFDAPVLNPPTKDGLKTQRTTPPRRKRSAPATEIALDDSLAELNVDFDDEQAPYITEIVVNRQASGGQNVDGERGDEGLNLLVQPRTADGSVTLVSGRLSVDLIDPASSPDKQAIGHWQFLPPETELFFASDRREGNGILLHLPWDQNLPTHHNLVVSVSFTTPDGRVLSTSSRLHVDPPAADYSPDDPQVAGWTERDTRWEIGTHNQSTTNDNERWTKSRNERLNRQRQLAADDDRYDYDDGSSRQPNDLLQRPRVKAIPASTTTQPSTLLPSWRPVR